MAPNTTFTLNSAESLLMRTCLLLDAIESKRRTLVPCRDLEWRKVGLFYRPPLDIRIKCYEYIEIGATGATLER
jgi:hypothetical protein